MSKEFNIMSIEELELGSRINNALKVAGIYTVEELIKIIYKQNFYGQAFKLKNIAEGSLSKIKDKLIEIGAIREGETLDFEGQIEQLGLTTKAYNALKRAGIDTIQQLERLGEQELSKITYLGEIGIAEIQEKLRRFKSEQQKGLNQNENIEGILIGKVGFSTAIYNILSNAGIQTIGELLSKTREEIGQINGIGRNKLKELEARLMEFAGIKLLTRRDIDDRIEKLDLPNKIYNPLRRAGICMISQLQYRVKKGDLLDVKGIGQGNLAIIENILQQYEQEITSSQTELYKLRRTKEELEKKYIGVRKKREELRNKIKIWEYYENGENNLQQ